ncbi:MAG: sugar O-acetyltransferase [Anaerolineales bacterium]|nr:sugar O-acetyltransferase [Anaerolineales bacterium]
MDLKSEKEKMLAGERYNFFDPELEAIRQNTKKLLHRFNTAEDLATRQNILKQLAAQVGTNAMIEPPFYCSYGQHTYLGNNAYLNAMCAIVDNNEVRIGNHVMVGPHVQIYTAAHDLQAQPRNEGWEVAKAIVIADNVWIGGGAILLPGVTVGLNAVVGAGAVVTKDVPPNTVVAGNPARAIREIEQ